MGERSPNEMKPVLLENWLLELQSQFKILDLNLKEAEVIKLSKLGLPLESTSHVLFCFLDKMRMIYSSFGKQNKITLTDLMFQIKGHGGISIWLLIQGLIFDGPNQLWISHFEVWIKVHKVSFVMEFETWSRMRTLPCINLHGAYLSWGWVEKMENTPLEIYIKPSFFEKNCPQFLF